jgi:hypothetical protein
MLKEMTNLPAGLIGVYAEGRVTGEDYEKVMIPALERSRQGGKRVRFLYQLGTDFSEITAGAALEDFRIGMKYLRLFEKCAIVTDVEWILRATRFMAHLIPCPTRTFKNSELADAKEWLASSEMDSKLDFEMKSDGVLVIKPHGALRREDFDRLASVVDPWIETNHALGGVVVCVEKFPGWQDFGSFVQHFEFVKSHHRKVRRVAIAANGTLPEIAAKLTSHFIEAEVKQFPYEQAETAMAWAAQWAKT